MSHKKIIQIFEAVNLLSRPQGATIHDLETRLEISRRSVYRLFDLLQQLNFPIYDKAINGKTKSWHLEERYLRKLPNLSIPEIFLDKEVD